MPKRADDENEDALRSDVAISTLFDVRGKVVVISGGGSGLGAMMATAFVRNGAPCGTVTRQTLSTQPALTLYVRPRCDHGPVLRAF